MKKKVKKVVKDKTTKLIEKDVNYLTNPTALYVSLVRHGANQEPFLVVKSEEKEGEEMLQKIIQRIIISKDLDSTEADKYLSDAKTNDEHDYDHYLAYDQVSKDACDPASFDGIQLDKEGKVFAVTAVLTDKELEAEVLKVSIPENEEDRKLITKSVVPWDVYDRVVDEMWSMEKIVAGTMGQSEATNTWRKEAIAKAVGNFTTFIDMALDSFDIDAAKMAEVLEKRHTSKVELADDSLKTLSDAVSQLQELIQISAKEETTVDKLFESKEEVAAFVVDAIRTTQEADSKAEGVTKAAKDKADTDAAQVEIITGLVESVKTLKETVEKIAGTVPGSGSEELSAEEEAAQAEAAAKALKDKDAKPDADVFKGLIMVDGSQKRTAIAGN